MGEQEKKSLVDKEVNRVFANMKNMEDSIVTPKKAYCFGEAKLEAIDEGIRFLKVWRNEHDGKIKAISKCFEMLERKIDGRIAALEKGMDEQNIPGEIRRLNVLCDGFEKRIGNLNVWFVNLERKFDDHDDEDHVSKNDLETLKGWLDNAFSHLDRLQRNITGSAKITTRETKHGTAVDVVSESPREPETHQYIGSEDKAYDFGEPPGNFNPIGFLRDKSIWDDAPEDIQMRTMWAANYFERLQMNYDKLRKQLREINNLHDND